MKRNITIAAVTAAVLIGGGAAATMAFADDDGDRRDGSTSTSGGTAPKTITTGGDDAQAALRGDGRVTLDDAIAAALKSVPGKVTGAELDDDDDDDRDVWELDVFGADKVWHDVTVDARNGTVLTDRDDDNDDRDRHAPRSASVSLNSAVQSALRTAPGSVTSVDLDDDDDDDGRGREVLRWDIDITGEDGKHHELRVDAKNGKVTVDQDDDDRDDDRADDRDDRDDDRDDS
ncbi:PepSY domain-containing protein [Streptomyces sp. NBC_00654]|uniref:PepSY domain-containing protein n=1 Tax=Streptomyces sp. NBC_00654 TaxID=2975799 RepID=UPI00225B5199|nr:PepSY domain-containing protein [Streptomyces sp. NBC_00654]MCX4964877.1 PepSY domain-containing protein [Streptomyces sp. NBC_00654]